MALAPFSGYYDAKEYQYRSLAFRPRVFRLIRLLPPARSCFPFIFSDTLRVEIIETDLDAAKPTEYDTLSYSWGVAAGARPDRRVLVQTEDGHQQTMWIHRPLEAALRSMAANRVTERPIFVDQICINQADGDEKAVQVLLMGEIYTRGQRVVVWLGPSTRLSNRFFDMAREMNEQGVMSRLIGPNKRHFMEVYDAVLDPDPNVELTGVKKEDRDDLLALIAKSEDTFSQDAMIHVLERPWFNRLWVIQEACLAPDVTFLCGSKTLCFECFRCSCAFFPFYNGNWIRKEKGTVPQREINRANLVFRLLGSFNRIFQERKAIHELGQKQTYYDIMLKYNVSRDGQKINCTKAEDRLFAVLGLAAEDEVYNNVTVRYDDTEGDTRHSDAVFTEFASLAVCQNLDFLCLSQFPKTRPKLPSWVPDWSTDLTMSRGYLSLKQPMYAAGGPMPDPPPRVDTETNRLYVSGLLVGKIVHVGHTAILRDWERPYQENVDYKSLKRFYTEAEDILLQAGSTTGCPLPYENDEKLRRLAAVRLSDFDMAAKGMATRYGYDNKTIYNKLKLVYEQCSKLGQALINSEENVRAHSLTRIIRTVGIAPYYWIPTSEIYVARLCAISPVIACKTWLRGVLDFATDMVMVCVSAARIAWATRWLQLKRRYGGVQFHYPDREKVLARLGLSADEDLGGYMAEYTEAVYRNLNRKLYLTDTGYVGVGPSTMEVGDDVAVLLGATVPHVLRPCVEIGDTGEETVWSYLGETYCDGVMEGQLFNAGKKVVPFKIV